MTRFQWSANAPLLALSTMLLPAGTIGDRFGHVRVLHIGLVMFAAASAVCAAAPSDSGIIAARLGQGVGGASVHPAVLALLRAATTMRRSERVFLGIWAAWTGAAGALGPLLGDLFVHVLSRRAISSSRWWAG